MIKPTLFSDVASHVAQQILDYLQYSAIIDPVEVDESICLLENFYSHRRTAAGVAAIFRVVSLSSEIKIQPIR